MRQQPEQFEPDDSNRAPDTLIPNVMARLGLDGSNNNATPSSEIIEQLHDDNWQTRLAAVEALGSQHTQLPVETLLPLLQDSDASVRAATVRVLGQTNDEEMLKRLQVALHDPNWHVRETAVFVLGNSAYPPLELLTTLQSDEDSTVRDAATTVMHEIQGDQLVIQPLLVSEAGEELRNGHISLHIGTQGTSTRQADSALSRVYGYMNFLWFLPRTRGGKAMLRERTGINENRQTETRATRKARRPIVRVVEGVLAAVLILGLVASWLILSQRFYTSTAGTVLLQQHLSGTFYPSWSPDGKRVTLISYGQGNASTVTAYVWDIATDKLTKTLSLTKGDALTTDNINVSPNSKYISRVQDNLLRVWDTSTGRNVLTYGAGTPFEGDVAWSSDGQYIAAIGSGIVRTWRVSTGTLVSSFIHTPHNSPPIRLIWSTSDERLLVGYDDSILQIWNPLTSTELQSIQEAPAPLVISWLDTSRIMVSDARTSSSSNQNTSIRVWDVVTGRKLVTYTAHTAIPDTFDTSPDGRRILSTNNRESLLWDSTTGKTILHIPTGESLRRPSFSPDGKFVEDADSTNTIHIWDATTGNTIANYRVNSDLSVYNVDYTYWLNENSLVMVRGGKFWILAPMTGQVRYSFDLHAYTPPSMQWSADYKKIAVALDDGTVEIVQGID